MDPRIEQEYNALRKQGRIQALRKVKEWVEEEIRKGSPFTGSLVAKLFRTKLDEMIAKEA